MIDKHVTQLMKRLKENKDTDRFNSINYDPGNGSIYIGSSHRFYRFNNVESTNLETVCSPVDIDKYESLFKRNSKGELIMFNIPLVEVYKPLSALTKYLDDVVITFNGAGVEVRQSEHSKKVNKDFINATIGFDTGLTEEVTFTVQYKYFMDTLMAQNKLKVTNIEFVKKNHLIELNSDLLTSVIACIRSR